MKSIQKRLGSLFMAAVMLLSMAVAPAMAALTASREDRGSFPCCSVHGDPGHGGREKRTADNSERLHDSIFFKKIQHGHHGV